MFLKTLSLYGFKTFANKTEFEFLPGFTAIVGPNGSGKSNLIDAIIWVMGEQSVRSIRGRKMEEVIFHGSEAKRPQGYAQVILTFDNEDGFFPLPHSEISLMRRYYKSGESEFAINREPCRLRDIQALMRDTGLGMMNYSVISQGDVEYIIDLSPLQRREIFDEAAGINRYKVEKSKTLSKVKETDLNISRLRDILLEIEENLGSLKEQADRARRYEDLTEEIESLKLRVFVAEIRRHLDKLDSLNAEELTSRRNISAAEELSRKTQERLRALSDEVDATRAESDEKLALLATIEGGVARATETLRFLQRSKNQYDEQIASLDKKKHASDSRIAAIAADLENSSRSIESKKSELIALEEKRASLGSALSGELSGREKEIASSISSLRSRIDSLKSDEMRIAGELDLARRRKKSYDSESATRTAELAELKKNIASIRDKLAAVDNEEKFHVAELDSLRTDRKRIDAENEELRHKSESLREAYSQARDAHNGLTARIEALEKVAESLQSLQAFQSLGDQDSLLTSIRDWVAIPAQLMKAASKSLGAFLTAAVTESSSYSVATESAPPVAVFSDWFEGRDFTPPAFDVPGLLGALASLSDFSEKAPAFVRSIFARVLVFDSLSALIAAAPNIPENMIAVSADGAGLFSSGLYQSGEDLITPEAITEKLHFSKSDILRKKAREESLKADYNTVSARLSEVDRQRTALLNRLAKLEQSQMASSERKKALLERLDFYAAEEQKAANILRETDPPRRAVTESIAELEVRVEETRDARTVEESKIRSHEREALQLAEERKRRESARSEIINSIEKIKRQIDDLRKSAEYLMLDRERCNLDRSSFEQQIIEATEKKNALAGELNEATREASDWSVRKQAAQQEASTLKARLAAIAAERRQLTEEDERQRNDIAAAREAVLQIELRRARTETQLEEIRRQFVEEFPGLSEDDALAQTGNVEPGEKSKFRALRTEREALLPVNQLAIGEYEEKGQRHSELSAQIADLDVTRAALIEMIHGFDRKSEEQFIEVFTAVQQKFNETFVEIFRGGEALLILTDESKPLESGVDIKVCIPGKKMRNITLLSGGEKALCAMTLIFAILKVKPSPFYLLDEVDAGLDEVNVQRYGEMVHRYAADSQFVVITHNKGTLTHADHFHGITLDPADGYSKVLSVSLE